MRDDAVVYDLGEVRLNSPETSWARRLKVIGDKVARSRGALPAVPARRSSVSPALSGSLSLFLPGATFDLKRVCDLDPRADPAMSP